MDLKRFHAIFVEEASEHLETLENGFMELEKNPDNAFNKQEGCMAAGENNADAGKKGLDVVEAHHGGVQVGLNVVDANERAINCPA